MDINTLNLPLSVLIKNTFILHLFYLTFKQSNCIDWLNFCYTVTNISLFWYYIHVERQYQTGTVYVRPAHMTPSK